MVTGQLSLLSSSVLNSSTFQRFGISSSASPEPNDGTSSAEPNDKSSGDAAAEGSNKQAGSDSDEGDLSMDDLVRLVAEKEELLKTKQTELQQMQDRVLRSYAEMENVRERAKREVDNSNKFAIQSFAKSLLDVADNLGRASSVVKESFGKLDTSEDTAGAVPLLKTLLEGVEMTDKQLAAVFKKFGVEKFDPTNEQFDPNRHNAAFQVPDPSKPSGTVAVVLKPGYSLHERIIRPAEVGVVENANGGSE